MPRNFQIGECDAEGCERAKKVHGYCDAHYRRWRKFGDPRADDPILLSKDRTGPLHPRYKGRITRRDGYVQVWRPGHPLARADGYVQEHRLVLYEAGIDVPRGAHVHHLNHVKDDNRVENLRVMTASEHMGHHTKEGTEIINQFGVFRVKSDEERKRVQQERMKRWRAANKEHIRAYKDQRRAQGLVP